MTDRIYETKNSSDVILEEKDIIARVIMEWLRKNWTLPYYIVAFYLISLLGIHHIMKSKKAFELKGPLLMWNALLACYSMFTTYHMLSHYIPLLRRQGFSKFLCDNSATTLDNFVTLIAFINLLSKIFELGDTYFIVLRKRHLLFLHCYHHVTVLLLSWHLGMEGSSLAQYTAPVNTLIHSVMYSYFAIKALQINVPRFISIVITSMQIMQMFFALALTCFMYILKLNGHVCHVSDGFLKFAGFIYSSYAVLFVKFFLDTYVRDSRQTTGKLTKVA